MFIYNFIVFFRKALKLTLKMGSKHLFYAYLKINIQMIPKSSLEIERYIF